MEMIEVIKSDYERWKKADAEWIDATLELAKHLAEARKTYRSDNDFGAWLEQNGVKITADRRAAFVGIGAHLEEANEYLHETKSRSVDLIWRAFKKRYRNAPIPDSAKSKPAKKKAGRPRTREFEFAPQLLAAIRRKRKEAHDVRISRKWRPEAVNKIMLHDLLNAVEQFLEDFINHRKISLDAIDAIKRDPRAAERSIDYVEKDQRGIGNFDA